MISTAQTLTIQDLMKWSKIIQLASVAKGSLLLDLHMSSSSYFTFTVDIGI